MFKQFYSTEKKEQIYVNTKKQMTIVLIFTAVWRRYTAHLVTTGGTILGEFVFPTLFYEISVIRNRDGIYNQMKESKETNLQGYRIRTKFQKTGGRIRQDIQNPETKIQNHKQATQLKQQSRQRTGGANLEIICKVMHLQSKKRK